MKEFEDWDNEDITWLFKIIDSSHKAKNAEKLSEILDEVNDLRELLKKIPIEKVQGMLKKLVDVLINRQDKEGLDHQEKT